MGAPLVDGKVESPHRTTKRSTRPFAWLAAAFISIILASAWQLDGPSDLDVIQAVADNAQAVQTDKLILAGQP